MIVVIFVVDVVLELVNLIIWVVVVSFIGIVIEFYDFYVYVIVVVLVIGLVFFLQIFGIVQMFSVFFIFGIVFFVCLLGLVLFGYFGDCIGCKLILVVLLLLMGVFIILIGVFFGYDSIGYWVLLLFCVLCFGQGFGFGGEWGGVVLLVMENVLVGKCVWFGMFFQFGLLIGFFVVNGLFLVLVMLFSEEQFCDWGWWILFLFSVVLVVVGFYVCLKLVEILVFVKVMVKYERVCLLIVELFVQYWWLILFGVLVMVVCYVLFYIFMVFLLSYGVVSFGFSCEEFFGLLCFVVFFMVVVMLLLVWFSDCFGCKLVLLFGSLVVIVFGFVMELLFSQGLMFSVVLFFCIELFLMGVIFVLMGVLLLEIFFIYVCYIGVLVVYNLGGIFGVLVVFYIVQKLVGIGGLGWVGGYVFVVVLFSLLVVLCLKEICDNDFGVVF